LAMLFTGQEVGQHLTTDHPAVECTVTLQPHHIKPKQQQDAALTAQDADGQENRPPPTPPKPPNPQEVTGVTHQHISANTHWAWLHTGRVGSATTNSDFTALGLGSH
jgi:hypothetical protein